MSAPAIATVEVLTAQVRVLMVGSRQVTLSVAKQLDFVGPGEIEPFGRIKLDNAFCAIGARKTDGTLVLAREYTHYDCSAWISADDLQGKLRVCWHSFNKYFDRHEQAYRVSWRGELFYVDKAAIEYCDYGHHADADQCDSVYPTNWQFVASVESQRAERCRVANSQLKELPLIVLAGLK